MLNLHFNHLQNAIFEPSIHFRRPMPAELRSSAKSKRTELVTYVSPDSLNLLVGAACKVLFLVPLVGADRWRHNVTGP